MIYIQFEQDYLAGHSYQITQICFCFLFQFPNQLVVSTRMILFIELFCVMWMLLINIKVSHSLKCM